MQHSLVLIQNTNNHTSGVGTVIYANQNHQYILTSAKLIEGFPQGVIIQKERSVKLIYHGSKENLDLAILKIEFGARSLILCENIQEDTHAIGVSPPPTLQSIHENLKTKTHKITSTGEYLYGWEIPTDKFSDGSPLICQKCGKVVAMVSHHQNFAIAVENLKKLSSEIPRNLIQSNNHHPRLFISLSHTLPEMHIARKISQTLKERGYQTFLALTDITIGENWVERLSQELNNCEYFLLLLSKNSIQSEMVAEELNSIRARQTPFGDPQILPIRINLPYSFNQQYEMLRKLENINQLVWEKEEDTPKIIDLIDMVISQQKPLSAIQPPITIPTPSTPQHYIEQPTGIVPFDSKSYIQREEDLKCYEHLSERYSLIRIKAPNKYGKTSLLERLNLHAKKKGYAVVSINFQEDFERSQLANLSELLENFCEMILRELNLDVHIHETQLKCLSSKPKATLYMTKILTLLDRPLVLSIDDADKLFEFKDVSNDFFPLIRSWNEKSKVHPDWINLKIILAYSTEPLLGVTTLTDSPFDNLGLGVELEAFSKEEIKKLAKAYGIKFSQQDIEDLFNFIGGHPLLTKRVLYTMVKENRTLQEIIQKTYYQKSTFFDHLRRYLWIIKRNKDLEEFLQDLLQGKYPTDDTSAYILEATGFIKKENRKIRFACELYRNFFQEHLQRI